MFKHPLRRCLAVIILVGAAQLGRAEETTLPPLPPTEITLPECYQRAVIISENLAISEEEIRQLEANYRQIRGGILPQVSWNMTQLWQDTSDVESSSGGVQGTLLRQRRPEAWFELNQPLFHGLREFNALRGFRAAREGAEFQRDQTALNLLGDVADVFYITYDLQQELEVLGSQRVLTQDRLKELERRVRLGRSRDSEILSSQVELASLDALIEDTRQRWAAARQTLYFLTQVPETVRLTEKSPAPILPALDASVSKSVNRPDVLAADKAREQEHYRVKFAKGGFLPGLDFTGRYYTERVGFNEAVKWDALLFLNVPIFKGGSTRADVQLAQSQLIAADLTWSRTKRLAQRDVEAAHANLRYTLSQLDFYARAVDLAQRNYKLQQEEYRLGLINNLQVLDVLNDLQDLKLRQLRSDTAARLYDVRLRVAMGQGL